MPSFEFEGQRVNYEIVGSGPPLLLHHGFMQWAEDWSAAGWVRGLSHLRTLVLFDALGHGRSDRPHDGRHYLVESRSRLVLALADALGLDQFGFFGFSMGGRVGYEVAQSHGDRLAELIVGGMHARSPSLDAASLQKRVRAFRSGRLAALERAVGALNERPANDAEALARASEASLKWPGAESRLACIKVPALVFCGTLDPLFDDARDCAARIAGAQFVALEGATHAHSFYRSGLVMPRLQGFLAQHPLN